VDARLDADVDVAVAAVVPRTGKKKFNNGEFPIPIQLSNTIKTIA